MGRWIAAAVLIVVALGSIALARGEVPCDLLAAQPSCHVAVGPGPTEDTLTLVSVEGVESFPSAGELRLTTIAVQDQLTVRSWLQGIGSSVVDVVPREEIYPPGSDPEQVAEENAALMIDSQLVATIAALSALGFELEGEGALVAAVTEDAVTAELVTGDVIVTVDGVEVLDSQDVVDVVQANAPGTTLLLGVASDGEVRDVEVTLGSMPDDQEAAYIGVLLTTELDLPVDVQIDAGMIGGPSAGLMFALSIIDLLGEEDLTGGAVIAGTGTVDRDGTVGAVGGVRQKLVGATAPELGEPATVFLVPRDNLDEARFAPVAEEVQVVPVDTLDDALQALTALRADRTPDDAVVVFPPQA